MTKKSATLVGTIAIVLFTTAAAKAEVTSNESINFDGFSVFVPCANGGAGEDVVFTGYLHIVLTETTDTQGGLHLKTHGQPQGLTGVGAVTGDKYQATGVTQDTTNNIKVGMTYTFVNNFRLIGQGPGNNFLAHETYHVMVNADGDITLEHDNLSEECK